MSVTLLTCPRLVFNARGCSLGADNTQKNNYFLHSSRTEEENDKTNGREEKNVQRMRIDPICVLNFPSPNPKVCPSV